MSIEGFIKASHGEIPVDLLLRNVKLVNLFSCEVIDTNVAVYRGKIVGFGEYDALEIEDLNGSYLAPGLIDGHVHIESSMLCPAEFVRAVLPMGTTTVVADPHEIVNVMGLEGLQFMMDSTAGLPLDVFFMIPSCVPATHLETSGAAVTAEKMKKWIDHPRVLGVGEMMNFPGVIYHDPQVLKKIAVAGEKQVDGHAPLVRGKDLSAYITAGIKSDHECTEINEAIEKLSKGMFIMIREGSAARNMEALLPLVNQQNSRFCGFITDDRHPDFLMDHGHINSMVKEAIKLGVDPITAIQMASLNTASHFKIKDVGAIAPGYFADMIVFDDFKSFVIKKVYKSGKLVAEGCKLVEEIKYKTVSAPKSVHFKPVNKEDLRVEIRGDRIHVIEIVPNQIITKKKIYKATIKDSELVSNSDKDILKIVVIERHKATGNIGIGFVKGVGLKEGAIASTVAHDSHNIIIVGVNDTDILKAVETIKKMSGGQVVIKNGEVSASLSLPIAGLLSDKPLKEVRDLGDNLTSEAHKLGCVLENPFMTLSFLALPVIPELKITDKGLVDVNKFDFVSLF
ncbi:MAG: adenine deaminase, partial [Candidatus Marinimicrobia bacterium]|nr:adenine deaminase [Candidatus Neomarinimicrobiota bacterium]